jgi:phage terminase Nu1 subunit (DNA packaging protein)
VIEKKLDESAGKASEPDEKVVALDPFGDVAAPIIARLLNLTIARVQQLAKEGVIARAGRGRYNVAACVRGYVAYLQARGAHKVETDPDSLEPFKRKAHYQAESDKMKLAKEQGELIPADEVEDEMATIAKLVTETLETLPDILERDTGATPRQIAITERAIDRVRETLYSKLKKRGALAQRKGATD